MTNDIINRLIQDDGYATLRRLAQAVLDDFDASMTIAFGYPGVAGHPYVPGECDNEAVARLRAYLSRTGDPDV